MLDANGPRPRGAYDILMPDARGYGRLGPIGDGFTVQRLAADVAGLLDPLGVRGTLLLGHSMGAVTAATLAAERPDLVRAMVLEDPPLDPPPVEPAVRRHGMRADLDVWRTLPLGDRHRVGAERQPGWHRLETDPWSDAKACVDPKVLDHLDAFERFAWRELFGRLTVPGLLVTGDPQLGALVRPERPGRPLGSGRRDAAPGRGGRALHPPRPLGRGHAFDPRVSGRQRDGLSGSFETPRLTVRTKTTARPSWRAGPSMLAIDQAITRPILTPRRTCTRPTRRDKCRNRPRCGGTVPAAA